MRIAITGDRGYIGTDLEAQLRQSGPQAEIRGWDKIDGEDITDPEVMKEIVEYKPDILYNLAGLSGEGACRKAGAVETEKINVQAPARLRADLGPRTLFVQASSASVLGLIGANVTPYAYSKWQAEQELKGFANTIICRFATVFGFNRLQMRWDLALNLMCKTAVEEKVIRLEGPDRWRPWVSLRELTEVLKGFAVDWAAGSRFVSWGGPVPVAECNKTLLEMANLVAGAVPDAKVELLPAPSAGADMRNYSMPATLLWGSVRGEIWLLLEELGVHNDPAI